MKNWEFKNMKFQEIWKLEILVNENLEIWIIWESGDLKSFEMLKFEKFEELKKKNISLKVLKFLKFNPGCIKVQDQQIEFFRNG